MHTQGTHIGGKSVECGVCCVHTQGTHKGGKSVDTQIKGVCSGPTHTPTHVSTHNNVCTQHSTP